MSLALITGGSKGIGKAIAEELAKRKINLLLVARSEEALKSLTLSLSTKYSIEAHYFVADFTSPNAPDLVFNWCLINNFPVSILINNAGFGLSGPFESHSVIENQEMTQVNMMSLVKLTQLFLPELKKAQQAYIMNIASTASYQAVAGLSLYAATKAFVLSFGRGLRQELVTSSVSITSISPGPTETNFAANAKMKGRGLEAFQKISTTATRVAQIAVESMFKRKAEVIIGLKNKTGAFLSWLLPKSIVEKVAGQLYNHSA